MSDEAIYARPEDPPEVQVPRLRGLIREYMAMVEQERTRAEAAEAKLAEVEARAEAAENEHMAAEESERAACARWVAAEVREKALWGAAEKVVEPCPACDLGQDDCVCICTELSVRIEALRAALAAGRGTP